MAGRELDIQYSGVVPGGGRIDFGAVDFSAGSATVDYPTVLTRCTFAVGFAQSATYNTNQNVIATTDGDFSDGKITFTRQGPYITEDARFYVLMMGN